MKAIFKPLLLLLLAAASAQAFPPAPYYTLFGMVRDQVGQTVTAEGAEVILLKGGVEVGRTPISSASIRTAAAPPSTPTRRSPPGACSASWCP
jgi:hypothetical protein